MYASYEGMMDTYARQQQALADKPGWINVKTTGAIEPPDMTVTHVNQTRDLMVNNVDLYHVYYIKQVQGTCGKTQSDEHAEDIVEIR